MGRKIAILGLLAAAGCGEGEGMLAGSLMAASQSASRVTLTVANQGTGACYGTAEGWDGTEKHSFTLNPGDVASFDFSDSEYRVKLHAWRSSDSLIIFDDFWDTIDMKHGVTVTLNP